MTLSVHPWIYKRLILVVALLAAVTVPAHAYDKKARIDEGIRLHDNADYDGAITIYRSILKDYPHDPLTVYELSFSWIQRGKELEELVQFIESELASDVQQHPGLPMLLGNACDALGQHAKGEAAFRRALDGAPDAPMAHYNLGVNLSLQKRWADSAVSFQEALRRKPDYVSAWIGLGTSLEELSRPALAFFSFARAAALEPDSKRGQAAASKLWGLLFSGVEEIQATDATKVKKEIQITIPVPSPDSSSEEAAPASAGSGDSEEGGEAPPDPETMEGLVMSIAAANRFVEEWEKQTDAAFFAHALDAVTAMFSELGDDPFWELALPWFNEAREKKHVEALAYVLRRSAGDEEAAAWIRKHTKAVKAYEEWKKKG